MGTKCQYVNGVQRFYDSDTDETILAMAHHWMKDDFDVVKIGLAASDAAYNNRYMWTGAAVNSGTYAIATGVGGHLQLTSGDADDDDVDFASEIIWNPGRSCCFETRLRMNDVSGTAMCCGFTDAQSEGADIIPLMVSTSTTAISACSDGALLVWDPDAATDFIRGCAIVGDADGTLHASTVAATDAGWHTYRVMVDDNQTVTFFVDGKHFGTSTGGVDGTNMCAYVGMINRETTANTVDVDYIAAWQTRTS